MKRLAIVLACVCVAACGESAPVPGSASQSAKSARTSSTPAKSASPLPKTSSPTAPPSATAPASQVVSASASAAPSSAQATNEDPAVDIKVTPFKLVEVGGKKQVIEVKADGTIVPPADSNTDKVKFVKNEIQDDKGKWVLRVHGDGSVWINDGDKPDGEKVGDLKDGTLTGEFGAVTVNDDGSITFTKDGKTELFKEAKFEGVTAENKQAAVLLMSLFLLVAKSPIEHLDDHFEHPGTPGSHGVSASASAAAPKK
ncbi:MAG: hypothetical protein U0271_46060 [Polyangiaceae bacterium]